MKKFIKNKLPPLMLKQVIKIRNFIPLWLLTRKGRWIRREYWQFGQDQRNFVFMSIARFMNINRPIPGYYFEFGCNEANTMRKAWDHFQHLFDLSYVGFDSFEGLPEIADIDKQTIWEKGKLAFAEEAFISRVLKHGIPSDKLRTVKGFYDMSLTPEIKRQLLPMKAAVIYIDCDLYTSTVPVLEWIVDFLQVGTIIVFDDWYCFHGDPKRGEQLAWKEFTDRHPELRFSEFVRTNEALSFIFIGHS
ncbi:MAG: class I SAM-dependent methyltransferase [Polynucleobacter sp.]|nr:class I SAM-dependent methyltransferase [Polynucleobacter sp.]